jgi:spermidine synthase
VFVPSFGEWGFVLAARRPPKASHELFAAVRERALRFLSPAVLKASFAFAPDMRRIPVEPNRLDTQALVTYYLDEMGRFH